MGTCECDWTYHRGEPCPNTPAGHGSMMTSLTLCTPCLYICEIEREDAQRLSRPEPVIETTYYPRLMT